MTKAKAKKLMKEYDRSVVPAELATKITKAFGFSLSDLDIKPQKTKDILGDFAPEETAELKGVSMYVVAQSLAHKITGTRPNTMKNGSGSGAEDIVQKAITLLE